MNELGSVYDHNDQQISVRLLNNDVVTINYSQTKVNNVIEPDRHNAAMDTPAECVSVNILLCVETE